MIRIVYLHGFLSSPDSYKAKITGEWLSVHRSDVQFICPFLSSDPSECVSTLNEVFAQSSQADTYVIGSSLGGFWSTYLVEHDLVNKAVLINPAVSPQSRFHEFVGKELENYYTKQRYVLHESDLDVLKACEPKRIGRPSSYYILLQEGDEVLDYRLAKERYCQCEQNIESGGNHGFDGYVDHLPSIVKFFHI